MTTITIILNDQKDSKGRFLNRQLIVSNNRESLRLTDKDAHAIAHDITQGNYHTAWINKDLSVLKEEVSYYDY